MQNSESTHRRILWITRTGVLVALLVTLQWATAGTAAIAGQYITGTCVNAVLAVSALFSGLWSGVAVALLSPFCAKLFGIGPQLIQIVPAIAAGNLVFVIALHFLIGRKKTGPALQAVGLAASAAAKFLTLYLLVVRFIVPMLSASLKPQQIATFSAMFSYPQLITAVLGGTVALLIVPILKKALVK